MVSKTFYAIFMPIIKNIPISLFFHTDLTYYQWYSRFIVMKNNGLHTLRK